MPTSVTRIGFDEAGLGPTLGPLVVAGFATQRRGDAGGFEPVDDLWRLLDDVVGLPGVRDGRIEVGDSKQIHAGAHKLRRIERSALAGVAWAHGCIPKHVGELLELVGVQWHPEWLDGSDVGGPHRSSGAPLFEAFSRVCLERRG